MLQALFMCLSVFHIHYITFKFIQTLYSKGYHTNKTQFQHLF